MVAGAEHYHGGTLLGSRDVDGCGESVDRRDGGKHSDKLPSSSDGRVEINIVLTLASTSGQTFRLHAENVQKCLWQYTFGGDRRILRREGNPENRPVADVFEGEEDALIPAAELHGLLIGQRRRARRRQLVVVIGMPSSAGSK